MCELFGLSCNKEDRATRSLPIFARYSEISKDGWGIAYYKNNNAIIKKKPEKAVASNEFVQTIDEAKSDVILAHIRFATRGKICQENCHPFKQTFRNKDWIFAHNGHVSGISQHPRSAGSTDSENIFNFLLDRIQEYMNQGHIRGIYAGLKWGLGRLFKSFGRNINLNFLMSDGNLLYVFSHCQGKPVYFLAREKDYGRAFLVSTQKLTDENWIPLPSDRLLLVNKGEIVVMSDII